MTEVMDIVHKMQLEMALEVKRICEKHNLKYTLIAGTLLGAVRHDGFIPWDDDLDIGMLREDFDRFISIAKNELKGEYFLQTWDSDPNFALPIAKMRKNNTKYVEQNSALSNIHNGVYIDIFPFDNVPSRVKDQKNQDYITYVLKRLMLIKQGYTVWGENEKLKELVYRITGVIIKPINTNWIKERLYRAMTKYNTQDTKFVVAIGGAYGYHKESIERKWITNLSNITFEEHNLAAPRDYDAYLSYFYGDYMTPPPENKRYNRHKIIEISLGDEEK